MFNESFATAGERLGSQRWLAADANQSARSDYAGLESRRQQFRALTAATRAELTAIYASNTAKASEKGALSALKITAMQNFRSRYDDLKKSWGSPALRTSGYDAWVAQANNASFGAQAAYDELVPGFEALFEREGKDWQRFYDAVRKLATLPKNERHLALTVKN